MTIHNVVLPENWSKGSAAGPMEKVQVVETYSGHEHRNIDWLNARETADISHNIRRIGDMRLLQDFARARHGRAYGFLVKLWTDYSSAADHVGTPSPTDQAIGTGNGVQTVFPITKTYADAVNPRVRRIRRIRTGTTRVALAGVEQMAGWTVNTSTGEITFSVAPGAAVAVTAGFEFYVPMRFDTDVQKVVFDTIASRSLGPIPLIEVRE